MSITCYTLPMELTHIFIEENQNRSVHYVLKHNLLLSRKQIRRLKINNSIFINEQPCTVKTLVSYGDKITVKLFEHRVTNNILSTNIPLDILYEDKYLLVINKPKNMLVHPVGKEIKNTLANGIKFYYEQQNIYMVARPIGRLDRNTTGVIIFAKNAYVHTIMANQLSLQSSTKQYLGIVNNIPNELEGIISLPIGRAKNSIIQRVIDDSGKISHTAYRVIATYTDSALVLFTLLTGRTHQIRVHAQASGNSLIGDTLYGHASLFIDRQALHSSCSTFIHPFTKEKIILRAKLPKDMKSLITHLR